MAVSDKRASLRCDSCSWALNDTEYDFLVKVLSAYRGRRGEAMVDRRSDPQDHAHTP